MVVFTCNHCGDSLQKPKVAKHYQFKCRSAEFLTCVDCFKDFRGDEYAAHTKCITESERYGGKDYVPKQSANKGERKQQAWLTVVQRVLDTSADLTTAERNMLKGIAKHDNVPRKKAKFMNFVRSASGFRVDVRVAESVWDKMERAVKEATEDGDKVLEKENGSAEKTEATAKVETETPAQEATPLTNGTEESETKKAKKRKQQTQANHDDDDEPAAKTQALEETTTTTTTTTNGAVDETNAEKFSWKNLIAEMVAARGEMKLRKLRNKAVKKYVAEFPESTKEMAVAKFDKKLGRVRSVVVEGKTVRMAAVC